MMKKGEERRKKRDLEEREKDHETFCFNTRSMTKSGAIFINPGRYDVLCFKIFQTSFIDFYFPLTVQYSYILIYHNLRPRVIKIKLV